MLGRLDEPDGCGTGAGRPESRKVVDVELDGELPPIAPAPVDERALILLVWLHHVAGTITRAPGYAGHGLWRRGNVDPIARAVVRAR